MNKIKHTWLRLMFCFSVSILYGRAQAGIADLNDQDCVNIDTLISEIKLPDKGKENLSEINRLEQRYRVHNLALQESLSGDIASAALRILELKRDIASVGGIIKYTAGRYVDALKDSVGEHAIDPEMLAKLASLNYMQQNSALLVWQASGTNNVACDIVKQIQEHRVELDRIGVDLKMKGDLYVVHSLRRSEILKELTQFDQQYGHGIETTVNPNAEEAGTIRLIRAKRAELMRLAGIPIWDGDRWVDARMSATHGRAISSEISMLLAQLNYWDRNYGELSMTEKMRDSYIVPGEVSWKVSLFKNELQSKEYSLQINAELGIWTIIKRD